jgi:hypothetical protein
MMNMASCVCSCQCNAAIVIAICAATLLGTGCGRGRPTRVPVSGQVLIDGKPLAYGSIMLVPQDARPSSGRLDDHGHFTLTCYDGQDGAVLGHHAVRIVAAKSLGEDVTQWFAPKKYADHRTSGLEIDIDGPTDSLCVKLTWAGSAPFVAGQR